MSERKSASAYRTISEVSESLGVPQHVLRFWETKFPAVKPLKRGGNRRYYRPEDLELLQVIHKLLHVDGYTIKGAQKLLKDRGVRALVAELLGGGDGEGTSASASASAGAAGADAVEIAAEAEVEAALAEAGIPEALTVEPDAALPTVGAAEDAVEPEAEEPLPEPALVAEAVEVSAPAEAVSQAAPAPVEAASDTAASDHKAQRLLVSELKSIRARLADALGAVAPPVA